MTAFGINESSTSYILPEKRIYTLLRQLNYFRGLYQLYETTGEVYVRFKTILTG